MTWIARHAVTFVAADGARWDGQIAIAEPIPAGIDFSCVVVADRRVPKCAIFGVSPLQAMTLALQLVASVLHDFTARGGQLLEPRGGTDLRPDLLFGRLWRPPAPYDGG